MPKGKGYGKARSKFVPKNNRKKKQKTKWIKTSHPKTGTWEYQVTKKRKGR